MYIKVKATPSAKKEELTKISEDTFQIFVKEPPRGGAANKRIVEVMSEEFSAKAKIISGHHSRNKIISVDIK